MSIIHRNGHTSKSTAVSVRDELANVNAQLRLKVSGTSETVQLSANPKNPTAFIEAGRNARQSVVVQGVMEPGKDWKIAVPFQVGEVR